MASKPIKRGRRFVNTPGPTPVADRVLGAMHRSTMDLSDPEFLDVAFSCLEDLKAVFRTEGDTFVYAANGHGVWESALANLFQPGDRVLMPETGNFSRAWSDMARQMGIEVETVENPDLGLAMDPAAIEARLRQDKAGEIAAVLIVYTDTATSITCDLPAIRRAIDAAGHPALLVVDAIAALIATEFRMDDWGIDVGIAAGQKGLSMPAGLGMVAVGEKALERHRTVGGRSKYWDWTWRLGSEHYQRFCGTAPQLQMFGLREALDMLFEEGIDAAVARHNRLARMTHAAVEQWGKAGALWLNAKRPEQRANAVTTIVTSEAVDPEAIRTAAREEMMTALGGGLADFAGRAFRIGHLGDMNETMLLAALAAVETSLAVLDVPYERGGVTAAIDVLATDMASKEEEAQAAA